MSVGTCGRCHGMCGSGGREGGGGVGTTTLRLRSQSRRGPSRSCGKFFWCSGIGLVPSGPVIETGELGVFGSDKSD